MNIPVVRITLCMYICLYSIVHSFVCDPVLILVKPAPIGCPIKCLSLKFEFVFTGLMMVLLYYWRQSVPILPK